MAECKNCKYAIWDYEEYYGGGKEWFVTDCRKGNAQEGCKEFKEEDNG